MKKYKTIKEFHEAVKSGEIDESEIEIVLDNDETYFYVGPEKDDEGEDVDNRIIVESANGYSDIEELYALVFPRASVEWC